jgi:hypothetical protein
LYKGVIKIVFAQYLGDKTLTPARRLPARVPFFFKQWGGYNKKKAGRLLVCLNVG